MGDSDLTAQWEQVCHAARRAAKGTALVFPEHGDRLRREAEEFCAQTAPADSDELASRETSLIELRKSWWELIGQSDP